MAYNFEAIHQLIDEALSEEDFALMCQYHFKEVHKQFSAGMGMPIRIGRLMDYVSRHEEIQKLLEQVKKKNPIVYSRYEKQLGVGSGTSPAAEPCDILILSANPCGTDELRLEDEAERIRNEFQQGRQRFVVKPERAVRVEDLSRHLLKYQPVILHFSGHGDKNGEIILENELQQPQPVAAEALARLLSVVQGRIECVILNACFSLERADALAEQVSCVIGMSSEIDDESALRFATGFYRGLAHGKGYYAAFEIGRNEISLIGLPDGEVPHFITRDTTLLDLKVVKPRVKRSLPTQREQKQATKYPLWFGTNRCPIEPGDLSKGFSSERDKRVHYGTCEVTVPKSHQLGSTGSPLWKRLLTLTDDRLKLVAESLRILDEAIFWTDVKQRLQECNVAERMALVFIHGFNVSFDNAALRAAQLGVDLQVLPGSTAFYSWPSKAKLVGYAADGASIEASETYIAEFLVNLAESSGAEQIHIIAHSMGNRGLLRSIQRILSAAEAQGRVSFGQIFLTAPDVDIDVFRDLAGAFEKLAHRTTLYLSSKDKALATSGIVHDYPRAGFCPPYTVLTGIDTIEVKNVDLTFLGHGYYAEAKPVLEDMQKLLVRDSRPQERGLPEHATGDKEKFWVIGK